MVNTCAVLLARGHKTRNDVVFAAPGDPIVLGVQTLQGFGIAVGANGFVSIATLAEFYIEEAPLRKAA